MGRSTAWGIAFALLPALATAQTPTAPAPPKKIANINLVTLGAGVAQFDHPNFPDGFYPAFAYQRRVLRREVRPVLIWVRAAFHYLADDAKLYNTYTVWSENDEVPFPDSTVSERTRDIALRGEAIADLLHHPNWALYVGAGFTLHSLSFTSDGDISAIPIFESTLTETSPSFLGGLRVFSATRAYTGYVEARYGQAFGKTENPGPRPWLTETTFTFTSVDALFLEAGVGVHW
jgi:hypothetical protein